MLKKGLPSGRSKRGYYERGLVAETLVESTTSYTTEPNCFASVGYGDACRKSALVLDQYCNAHLAATAYT